MKKLATTVLLCLSTQAHALSCLAPSTQLLYTQADQSEDPYVIVIGKLHPTGIIKVPKVSPDDMNTEDASTTTRVRMSGNLLGSTGFDTAFNQRIDVTVSCLSIWCGSPITDQDIVAALRMTDDVPVLEFGPCGGLAMPLEGADIEGLLACHRGEPCEPY